MLKNWLFRKTPRKDLMKRHFLVEKLGISFSRIIAWYSPFLKQYLLWIWFDKKKLKNRPQNDQKLIFWKIDRVAMATTGSNKGQILFFWYFCIKQFFSSQSVKFQVILVKISGDMMVFMMSLANTPNIEPLTLKLRYAKKRWKRIFFSKSFYIPSLHTKCI